MPTMERPKRPRVQLDFTPEAFDRLEDLVKMSRSESTAEMFRQALRLFEWYQVRKADGYRLLVQKDGQRPMAVDLGL